MDFFGMHQCMHGLFADFAVLSDVQRFLYFFDFRIAQLRRVGAHALDVHDFGKFLQLFCLRRTLVLCGHQLVVLKHLLLKGG